jgi:hypothetical protein
LGSYSKKKRVYFKPKPTKDIVIEKKAFVQRKKAFLKLDGKKQELVPFFPSPMRQNRSKSP